MFFNKEARIQMIEHRIRKLRANGEVKNLNLIHKLERQLKNLQS